VGLNVGYVDLQAGTLHIRAKGGAQERVFVNPVLVRMLGRVLKESPPEGNTGLDTPPFRSRWGTRLGPRPIQLRFAALCRKAGISPASGGQARNVSIHSLRHTFATRLYRKTGDLYLVQRALGHRHITTTEIYARVGDEQLRSTVVTSPRRSN
jgi:integrase/recombinase XerC